MKNKERTNNFTPEQQAAITHRGSSLLVSSAAGSGKTMVLVERLLGYIEDGHNIDEFLVITYTRAAASELRERIYARLTELLSESPGNFHLRRQSMLCRGAHIDTIHAFCATVLRENAHLAALPPDFRVADESECEIIKDEVLDDVFNRTYEVINEQNELKTMLEMLVEGRDDRSLLEIVREIHGKIKSIPDFDSWIKEQIELEKHIDYISDVSQTMCGKYILKLLHGRTRHCLDRMLILQENMMQHQDFKDRWAQSVSETIKGIKALIEAMETGWDAAVEHSKVVFPTPKPISGYDELKAIRSWCKSEMLKITKYLDIKSDDHVEDMKIIAGVISTLLKLVLDFENAYREEKRKRGIVDFSDLEHLTLSLLHDKSTGKKTKIAEAISKRFKEILVDEYQDVNEVQEMLFTALSQSGHNIFMVGDVKQSIYRFRLAEPSIFLEKYRAFEDIKLAKTQADSNNKHKNSVKINLSMNFRSKSGILEAVNHVFRQIMSVTLGEMEYTDAEALIPGRIQEQGKQGIQGIPENGLDAPPVEFDLLTTDKAEEDDEEALSSIEIEAKHVAERIKELVDASFMVEEKDGSCRPIRYSDIAILLRSVKGISWRFAKALSNIGIPSDISGAETYFETVEVQAALSILSVIDNPMQDIPLASMLTGPIFRFTSDELAEIRAKDLSAGYYETLKRSAEPNTESDAIVCKCREVLDEIDELRAMAYDYPTDRFILNVYNRTGLLKRVTAMKNGEKRKSNLLALVEYARNFEKNGYKGLFNFLNNIRDLQQRGVDITDSTGAGNVGTADNDVVKILSIHKSKGLEFPVVFLSNTAKKHNFTDLNKSFIFHKQLGIGGTITDPERRIRYSTLARNAIREKLRNELLSEELRVLYVAMTRAREKLIITAAFDDIAKREEKVKLLADDSGSFSPYALMSLNSVADWLLAGTLYIPWKYAVVNRIKQADDMEKSTGLPRSSSLGTDRENLHIGNDGKSAALPEKVFDFIYPYEAATRLPSKLTVTGLKSIADPEAEEAAWIRPEDTPPGAYTKKPAFASSTGIMTGAERGTLIHEVMRYIDYDKCSGEDEIWKDLRRKAELGFLDDSDIAEIDADIGKIAALFKSDLGKRLKNAKTLTREFRFSLLTPAKKYFADGGDEKILLQGIVDCFFEENGQLVVVDFKTDNVSGDALLERAKKYTPQLEGYGEALERITGKHVKERILYFFKTGAAVNV